MKLSTWKDQPWDPTHGDQSRTRKLSGEQVDEIRKSTSSVNELAKRFGVSRQTIYAVRKGRCWQSRLVGAKP